MRVRYSPHLLLTDDAQVHAEEMQLVHEEKVAAERLARQSERVALQQSLELETARTNNGTLAQVWHTFSYSHCTCRLSYLWLNHMVKHKPYQINLQTRALDQNVCCAD